MKETRFWALFALSHASAGLAQATGTSAGSATTTLAAPSCTASLIKDLCDYPSPGPEFAVAIESRASCWDYCDKHQPCDFVIFAAGNPYTGTGTCWLYPGKTFDASAGSSGCGSPSLSVYNKPVCAGASPTSAAACAATASPSAVASICGYEPPTDCFETCAASESASNCLSLCAKSDACNYAVFNPHNPSNSPYASGTCWIYRNGTFNAGSATTCSSSPEQFVYNNVCPKPTRSLASSSSPSPTGVLNNAQSSGVGSNPTSSSQNIAPSGLLISNTFAIGVAMMILQRL